MSKVVYKKEVDFLLNYLIHTFGYNKPFTISEIDYKDYSRAWIYKRITKLCEDGKIMRFERNAYYIPRTTKFGTAIFDSMKIIEKKYIQDGENVMGYFAGRYLQHLLGIFKGTPNTIEIYTNNETKRARTVNVGGKRVYLHTARTKIDKFNASILCFLELMNGIDTETLDEYKRKLIADYITENRITQKQITKYIPYFPDKTCRNLIESEVIYRVPQ